MQAVYVNSLFMVKYSGSDTKISVKWVELTIFDMYICKFNWSTTTKYGESYLLPGEGY